jgi:hypothetical protein
MLRRCELLSIALLLAFVCVPLRARCQPTDTLLIEKLDRALAKQKPIFDCFGLQRRIKRAWPGKCRACNEETGHRARIAFKISEDGKPFDFRLMKTSGSRICDQIDQTAIEKAQLFYVPTQEAVIVADFASSPAIADSAKPLISPERPQVSIVLGADKPSPSVSFVEYSGSLQMRIENGRQGA